jgi:hypothetical protein
VSRMPLVLPPAYSGRRPSAPAPPFAAPRMLLRPSFAGREVDHLEGFGGAAELEAVGRAWSASAARGCRTPTSRVGVSPRSGAVPLRWVVLGRWASRQTQRGRAVGAQCRRCGLRPRSSTGAALGQQRGARADRVCRGIRVVQPGRVLRRGDLADGCSLGRSVSARRTRLIGPGTPRAADPGCRGRERRSPRPGRFTWNAPAAHLPDSNWHERSRCCVAAPNARRPPASQQTPRSPRGPARVFHVERRASGRRDFLAA